MNRLLPFATLILMTTACSRHEMPVAAAGGLPPAIPEQVETVTASSVAETYRATGTVRARESAAIAAKIVATIREVRVQTGDHVKAGQVLAVLDDRDLEVNGHRAEATRSEVESAISESDHAIAAADANLELALATHRRFGDLLSQASVSRQEFDESQARLRGAIATREMAIAKRRQSEARLRQAEAELAATRVTLGYAILAAPFAGLVTERKADPGSQAAPGVPLLILERETGLRLEASIDESRIGLVRIGEQVKVEIDGLNRSVNGRIAESMPSIDAATRTFTVKVDVPALPGLRAGMFGTVEFAGSKRDALLISPASVLERGQIRSVFVVQGDLARLRLVTLGEMNENRLEVLSGLSAGDRIVVAPSPQLTDGRRIATQEATK